MPCQPCSDFQKLIDEIAARNAVQWLDGKRDDERRSAVSAIWEGRTLGGAERPLRAAAVQI
jgi:hypothetical protein